MRDTLPALTLHAPWAFAVAHLGKRIENRTWVPPARLVGQRLAIHAGVAETEAEWGAVYAAASKPPLLGLRPLPARGAVVAVVTVAGWVNEIGSLETTLESPSYEHVKAAAVTPGPWFIGPIGWVLTDVVTLPEPVPCKGRQGLWRLDAATDAKVREQEARAA